VCSSDLNDDIGENTVIAAQVAVAGSVIIEKNCMIGGQAAISGHLTVGEGSKIGPKAGIMSTVKPNSVLLGSPAVEFKQAMKTFSIIKNLPQLRDDVIELQKKIKSMETNQ
jgi:UDP-3-O-[3-hydroxymyristoyl] glucosamine N-acyltransferase